MCNSLQTITFILKVNMVKVASNYFLIWGHRTLWTYTTLQTSLLMNYIGELAIVIPFFIYNLEDIIISIKKDMHAII